MDQNNDQNNNDGDEQNKDQKPMSKSSNPFANYQPSEPLDTTPKLPLNQDGQQPEGSTGDSGPSETSTPEPAATPAPDVSPFSSLPSSNSDPEPSTPVSSAATSSSIYPSLEPISPAFASAPAGTTTAPALSARDDYNNPVAVVKVLSVRGLEYALLTFLLWCIAGAIMFIGNALIYKIGSFNTLSYPVSLLLVSLPGFAWLFLRLRAAELMDSKLKLEASKRRFSQITQIAAFLTVFYTSVTLLDKIVSIVGGDKAAGLGKVVAASLLNIAIAGSIFVYFWVDEHKAAGN